MGGMLPNNNRTGFSVLIGLSATKATATYQPRLERVLFA